MTKNLIIFYCHVHSIGATAVSPFQLENFFIVAHFAGTIKLFKVLPDILVNLCRVAEVIQKVPVLAFLDSVEKLTSGFLFPLTNDAVFQRHL